MISIMLVIVRRLKRVLSRLRLETLFHMVMFVVVVVVVVLVVVIRRLGWVQKLQLCLWSNM